VISAGTALLHAAEQVIENGRAIAGHLLEAAVADIEGSLRWHSSKADSVLKTLEVIYLKREEELSFLPLQTVCKAIEKATASAKAMSESNTAGYGCFVNPQTGNAKPSHP